MTNTENVRLEGHLGAPCTERDRMRLYVDNWYRFARSKRPPEEQAFWSGLTEHGMDLGPNTVAVRSLGDGPNVILLHGVGGRGSQFSHLARALADRGWRALIVDLAGPDERRARRFTVDGIAGILRELVRREGPLDGMVVHSMANLWAWYAMARGLAVDQLVTLSGVFRASWVFAQYQRLHRLSDQDVGLLKTLLEAHEGAEALSLQDPPVAMSRARRPPRALIIHGADDEVVPVAQGRAYASAWPEAAYLEIGAVSHADLLAAPDAVRAVSAFFGCPDPLRQRIATD